MTSFSDRILTTAVRSPREIACAASAYWLVAAMQALRLFLMTLY
jgi:hypothetical protein